MYQVTVRQHFDAAHYLRGYRGKCEAVHGHRFEVTASLQSEQLNDIGIAYDFVELKRRLNDILNRFDHVCLNDIPPFDKMNPSSENIAANVFRELRSKLAGELVTLTAVEVWESPENSVRYMP
ncbi:MAG: 6-carboxytetrahydropterin synthase QueD [Chloroflexi bacterium]|nr:6-carboxytetrahydropterin synthase QueD [Chloroflexota bacterium]